MNNFRYCIIFLSTILAQQDELLQVQIVWRHGARNYYFCNWGCDEQSKLTKEQLTPVGLRQHYQLGRWLRQRYIETGFLSNSFNENEIYIQSSDSDRTLLSAYSNLQGMYEEGPEVEDVDPSYLLPPIPQIEQPQIGKRALPNQIQVIPIHSMQNEVDYTMYLYCPVIYEMSDKDNLETPLFKEVNSNEKAQKLIQQFNKEMQASVTNVMQLYEWRDTFTCNRYNGEALPDSLTFETLTGLDQISGLAFALKYCQTQEQGQILSSPFFQGLTSDFDQILNGTSKYKYKAYSAHDSTILTFLAGLNLTSAECQKQWYFGEKVDNPNCIYTFPDFASHLIFELYKNTQLNFTYVKVMHNGTYVNLCGNNSTTCQYHTFKTLLHNQFKDYEQECGIESNNQIVEEKIHKWALALFIILIILIFLLSIFAIIIYRVTQKRMYQISEQNGHLFNQET